MQTNPDLHIFQVVDTGMQLFQISFEISSRFRRFHRISQICRFCRRQDLLRGFRQFFRLIESVVPVLIHQPFHYRQFVINAGMTHRRRLMADQAGGATPFRLHPLANDGNQIGINIRQIAQRQLRVTLAGQAGRFPRQPLQRTVSSDMHHRISAKLVAQPFIIGKIMMRRRAVRRMINLGRVLAKAARRLNTDKNISQQHSRRQ